MQAALLIEPGKVVVRHVETPRPGPSEVLVDVKSCGVCATDVKKFTGASKAPQLPFILGHEPAGVIREVGPGVRPPLTAGTRVAVAPVYTCGYCRGCRSGQVSSEGMGMCENYEVLGYSIDGAFAEAVVAPARHVHPLPDDLGFRDAALIEPVAACVNGVQRVSPSPPGNVVVIGAGFMGLVSVRLLDVLGNRVIASDLLEERRQLALALGAERAVDPKAADPVATVRELTDGRGADGVLCAIGGRGVTEQALDMLAKGGKLVLLASAPKDTAFELNLNAVHYDQLMITGSVSYTLPGYEWSMDLLRRGRLDTETLISAVGPLDETQKFLEMTRDLKGLKKVVMM